MTPSTVITEPAAVISGPSAYLLAKLLKAPPVAAYIRTAAWLHGPDFAAAVRAIHSASDAWRATVNVPQRQTADARVQSPHACDTMTTEQASETLELSRRRIQRLAQEGVITGHRIGGQWQLDLASIARYTTTRNTTTRNRTA